MICWRGLEIPVVTIIAFAICAFWASGMFLAPLTLPPNSVGDLSPDDEDKADGKYAVGAIDNANVTEGMNPYARMFYRAGDSQCHTLKERSLFIRGNQMPFCARDVGIFLGMALGMAVTLFYRVTLKWWWLVGGLVPIGIDGTVQLLTPYESTNILRITTGGLAGIVTTLALGFVIYDATKMAGLRYEPEEPSSGAPPVGCQGYDGDLGEGIPPALNEPSPVETGMPEDSREGETEPLENRQ